MKDGQALVGIDRHAPYQITLINGKQITKNPEITSTETEAPFYMGSLSEETFAIFPQLGPYRDIQSTLTPLPFEHASATPLTGIYLILPPHCRVEHPIYITHYLHADGLDTAETVRRITPRTLVLAAEHAQATLIETYVSHCLPNSTSEAVIQSSTHLSIAEKAEITHVIIQNADNAAVHLAHHHIQQSAHSHYQGSVFSLHGRSNQSTLEAHLTGQGAQAHFRTLSLAEKKQQITLHLEIQHHHPNCSSHTVTRGIVKASARSMFTGKVTIHAKATQSKAHLENKHLLLSPQAVAYTRPQLEVHTHDVLQCTHGATVGHLDQEALFYLQSRGIPAEEAEHMLMEGFLQPVLDQVHLPAVTQYLKGVIHPNQRQGTSCNAHSLQLDLVSREKGLKSVFQRKRKEEKT